MLPSYPAKLPADSESRCRPALCGLCDSRFGRAIRRSGVRRNEIEVKFFGGGDVLLVASDSPRPTVGRLNCEAALKVLEEEGFQL